MMVLRIFRLLVLFSVFGAAATLLPMNASAQSIVNLNANVPSFLSITLPVGSTAHGAGASCSPRQGNPASSFFTVKIGARSTHEKQL